MEVRPGFKQTDVGVIPAEWRVASIEDIGVVGRGRVISHKEIARTVTPTYPVYSSQTSNQGVMGYLDSFAFEGEYITWTTDGANAGTVFYRDGRFNCTNVCGTIKVKTEDPRFVARVLSRAAPHHVSRHLGNPKLMNDVMKRVLVPLAPLPEQRAIAAALSDSDELLDGLDRLIAKNRNLNRAARQQLLTGQTRLPGYRGEWIPTSIAALCEYEDGVATTGGDLGYIEIGDIDVVSKSYGVAGKEKLSVRGAVKVPRGTLLISTVRPTRGAIAITKEEAYVSSAFCRLRPSNGFLFHLVCQEGFLAYLGEHSFGGTYPTCKDETILSYECLMPSDAEEQCAIAGVLSDMDAELSAVKARRDKTRALEQGMIQELLAGKTRLVLVGYAHA